ncbi:MAG: GTPase HflX [Candidatus Electronema sp. V4]|uniref:GTPase HflX n=1 Tax=Candidatus Electronema sp. V4 TaxID=3454756 RepID=UPI0040558375
MAAASLTACRCFSKRKERGQARLEKTAAGRYAEKAGYPAAAISRKEVIISIVGHTAGLKSSQLRQLEQLLKKKISRDEVISRDAARSLAALSIELNRQLGLLIQRSGLVETVIVGDHDRIVIPVLQNARSGGGRLCGLRCVHTHFSANGPDEEDIMDLVCLRLDLMAVLTLSGGQPELLRSVHIQPERGGGDGWRLLEPFRPAEEAFSCLGLIEGLEEELARSQPLRTVDKGRDRAILVSVSSGSRGLAAESMLELAELARAAGVDVVERVMQQRGKADPRFILGRGKLMEVMLMSIRSGADLLIFDQELTPSQVRSITSRTDLRVIDRTQLILDIFARRALSREGRLQIEMAQLKYLLPFLASRDDSLSRLTGGIGARGPGETKLEIDRRRIKDRVARLSDELKEVGRQRQHRRSRRRKHEVPVVSLVGYTNAGKSTLLNSLTGADILAEDMLFATLDPTSRRFRLPGGTEAVLTDTVGFIRNLPAGLLKAFASTLEELHEADLLLHVIDAANPAWPQQAETVDSLLRELELEQIPCLRIYNKIDLLPDALLPPQIAAAEDGLCLSANSPAGLAGLLERIEGLMVKE